MVRQFNVLTDYSTITCWWEGWKFPIISPDLLPSTGFIEDGLAAGFLYTTNSTVGIMEWIVVNPLADKESRRAATDRIVNAAITEAKRVGISMLVTFTSEASLINRYQQHGFEISSDRTMTHLMRRI